MRAELGLQGSSTPPKYFQGDMESANLCFSFADCRRSLEEKNHRRTVIKTVIADELLSQDYQPLFHVADFYPTFSALIKQVNF